MLYFSMIKDLRLHGNIGPVEFFAFVGGTDIEPVYFYEKTSSQIRFFSKGSECIITEEGVHYKGAGGSFCEYMFGVEKPLTDMVKPEVLNRLIMFGAFLDEKDRIIFTDNIDGSESFYRLFIQGNAVKNYFFLVSSDRKDEPKKRQQQVLKLVGKFLKRTDLISAGEDTQLMNDFIMSINEPKSSVFIFKIIYRKNDEFYKAYKNFYWDKRTISAEEEMVLDDIASKYKIDNYQAERMKIDIMYRHPENKAVVDEYRDILVNGVSSEKLKRSDIARLNRLKTLGIRNNIPSILFDTLDELLLEGEKIQETKEPEYLREARSILETLFFKDASLKKHITNEDIIRLIKAKHTAYSLNDRNFEQILLNVGKACDDIARESNDFSIFEEFSSIVTYFDRYDNMQALLTQLAFTDNPNFNDVSLRSLIGNKKQFDKLDRNLFDDVIIKGLLKNKYITLYGRKKIEAVARGIAKISAGDVSLRDIVAEIKMIMDEDRLYKHLHDALKQKMRIFYPRINTKEGKNEIIDDIEKELVEAGYAKKIPHSLFEKVIIDLKKESFYINHLLPQIIEKRDVNLREDFLKNSGIDRFYIETVEKEHFQEKDLDISILEQIRDSKETVEITD